MFTRLAVLVDMIALITFLGGLYLITKANPSTMGLFRQLSSFGKWASIFAAVCALVGVFTDKPRKLAIVSLGAAIWLIAIFAFFTGGGDPTPLDRTSRSVVTNLPHPR
jgi:hypothetical protein